MQNVVVWILVAGVVFLVGRSFINVFKGQGGCCACGTDQCGAGDAGDKQCNLKTGEGAPPSYIDVSVSQIGQENQQT